MSSGRLSSSSLLSAYPAASRACCEAEEHRHGRVRGERPGRAGEKRREVRVSADLRHTLLHVLGLMQRLLGLCTACIRVVSHRGTSTHARARVHAPWKAKRSLRPSQPWTEMKSSSHGLFRARTRRRGLHRVTGQLRVSSPPLYRPSGRQEGTHRAARAARARTRMQASLLLLARRGKVPYLARRALAGTWRVLYSCYAEEQGSTREKRDGASSV